VSFVARTCIFVLSLLLLLLFSLADAETASPEAVVKKWTKLYGRKTVAAAQLTTDRFRDGELPITWGEKTEARLKSFGYQHLGGKIVSSQVSGETVIVLLRALIASGDGVAWKRETYTLQRVGRQWLIDAIEVTDEPH
jgi:hypothetical protein